jgi:hypothetical protein
MRIYGPAPFGQPSVAVPLSGGEVFYAPPGNYMTALGNQTVVQFFDSVNLLWRNVGFPGGFFGEFATDGFNFRLVNMSGVVQGALITNAGSGATTNGVGATATGVTIGFGAAPTNGIAASAYPIIGGKLSGLTIANGGSGFLFPPALIIDPPAAGGINATATCTISGGIINAVTLQNPGAGYVTTPNVYIVQQYPTYPGMGPPVNLTVPTNVIPGGTLNQGLATPPWLAGVAWPLAQPITSGASITANGITGSGTLTGIVMTDYGVGYTGTTIPTLTFSGGSLAGGAAATAIMSLAVNSLGTTGAAGVGYTVGTPWISSEGTVAGNDGCNGILQARPARGRIAATTGFTGTTAVVEDTGFGLQSVPNIGTLLFTTQPGTVSTTTAVCGGVFDVSVLSPGIED